MPDHYLERILRSRVYDVAIETPLDEAARLSRRLGNRVWFKREDLQPVFSFKIRGAYNRIAQLPDEVAARGVICASAGNHAQGVAWAARHRGIPCTIVMPETSPDIKVQAVAALGGRVELYGENFDACYAHAMQLSSQQSLAFIHPFDDPDVIAGQGTVAMELLRQSAGQIDAIFVPVGGGGLIAGIAAYTKQLYPHVRVIGVEPEDAAAMYYSMQAGERVTLDTVGNFADGVAVRRVGELTFQLARRFVDEIVLVTNDEICAAIQDVFEDTRSILEPSGALAVAGIKRHVDRTGSRDQRFVAINSGANMNFDRLRHVAERADLGARRESLLAVEIPERRGSFLRFCQQMGDCNITEFNYRFQGNARARIFVGFGVRGGSDAAHALVTRLTAAGYGVVDMSDNEMAKLHVRYMVGGRTSGMVEHERLFRFEFPERPGALLRFLESVGERWNISLFHYRNHGSDCGRVLAGIQVPPESEADFLRHLGDLHYPFSDETANPAYALFLGA